ncbi:MAG: PilZ domain-containing protein [Treponema sp.]|nr:PilZ domain-containing protein [Treponema sp.]
MFMFLLQEQVKYFKDDNPIAGYAILIGIGAILVLVFISSLIKNGLGAGKGPRKGSAPRRISMFAMRRVAKTYRLDHDQTKALEYVLRSNGVTDPETTTSNPTALDKHFKRAFKQIENNAHSEEDAQQKMALLFSVRNAIDIQHNTSAGTTSGQRISMGMSGILSVNNGSYPVKVVSAKGEIVLVDCPRNAVGSMIKFPKGTRVNLAFFSKNNKGYSFDSQVVGIAETSFGPALQLSHAREAKAMTQRRFRRTSASLNCDFYMVRIETIKSKKPPKMVVDSRRMTGSVMDISIGGCAIKTAISVPAGSKLKIEFDYANRAVPIAVLGQVLRINRSGIANTVIHIKFLKVPRKAMNAINTLVFEYSI